MPFWDKNEKTGDVISQAPSDPITRGDSHVKAQRDDRTKPPMPKVSTTTAAIVPQQQQQQQIGYMPLNWLVTVVGQKP